MVIEKVPTSFLHASDNKLTLLKERVHSIISKKNNKPYIIDYKKLVIDYQKFSHGCINEFSTNYTFGFFMTNTSIDSPENREAYFLEIKKFLNRLNSKDPLLSS